MEEQSEVIEEGKRSLAPWQWISIALGVGVAGWLTYEGTKPVFPEYFVTSEVAAAMADLEDEGEEICLNGGDLKAWLDRYMAMFRSHRLEYDGEVYCRSGFPGEDPRFGVTTAFVNPIDSFGAGFLGRGWELTERDEVSATFECDSLLHFTVTVTVEFSS